MAKLAVTGCHLPSTRSHLVGREGLVASSREAAPSPAAAASSAAASSAAAFSAAAFSAAAFSAAAFSAAAASAAFSAAASAAFSAAAFSAAASSGGGGGGGGGIGGGSGGAAASILDCSMSSPCLANAVDARLCRCVVDFNVDSCAITASGVLHQGVFKVNGNKFQTFA